MSLCTLVCSCKTALLTFTSLQNHIFPGLLPFQASLEDVDKPLSWDEICAQYDRDHENAQKFSWGDRMEMTESVRMPGRALEMHQKLSSPSRKKSRSESVRRSEERMV